MTPFSTSLCLSCRNVRKIQNKRGSLFLMCQKHATDKRFPKYPPQPVYRCPAYEAQVEQEDE